MDAAGLLRRDSLLADAAVGALVTLVLSVLPCSGIAGGLVAGHRRDRGYRAGLTAGALAGALAAVPLAALFVPAVWIATALGLGIDPASPAYDVFLALVAAFFLAYTVGLSAVGGLAGAWAGRNTEWSLDPASWL